VQHYCVITIIKPLTIACGLLHAVLHYFNLSHADMSVTACCSTPCIHSRPISISATFHLPCTAMLRPFVHYCS